MIMFILHAIIVLSGNINTCEVYEQHRVLIAGMMAPEKSWCLVECPAHWEPQEEGVMNTAARFSLS
jgi:hypothetical protein